MAQLKEFSIEEKLSSLINLQKIDSKLDEIKILKGELPMEVADLEDEIQGLYARQTRIEEEINGVTEFIEQRKLAIKEAEAYDGPSIIIAYSPCINHGLSCGMGRAQEEMKRAVDCGYWHLYRYNPDLKKEG